MTNNHVPCTLLQGIAFHAEGEANFYRLMRNGNWLARVQFNGELLVWDQEQLLDAMLQGQQAAPAGEPDCDRSACGDFSPGPCDNPDCPALRSNKAAPVGEREAFEAWCAREMGVYVDDVIGAEGDDLFAAFQAGAAYQRQSGVVMPESVGVLILGGLFHGGSGPELGDIDIEPDMRVLERIQMELVTSSDDVHLELFARLNGAGSHE